MDKEIRKMIVIKTQTSEEEYNILSKIHNQLVGNKDYIDSRIVLNDSSARRDGTKNEVHFIIFSNSETNPEIII